MNRLLLYWKGCNRTLLEMHVGMIFFGALCQVVGVACMVLGSSGVILRMPGLECLGRYSIGLWAGVVGAAVSARHMYCTLDRALDCGEHANGMIFRGYLIRYVLIIISMLIIIVTGWLNPLVVFLGYMSLKVTAFLQPFTHKLCNWILGETDPEG